MWPFEGNPLIDIKVFIFSPSIFVTCTYLKKGFHFFTPYYIYLLISSSHYCLSLYTASSNSLSSTLCWFPLASSCLVFFFYAFWELSNSQFALEANLFTFTVYDLTFWTVVSVHLLLYSASPLSPELGNWESCQVMVPFLQWFQWKVIQWFLCP